MKKLKVVYVYFYHRCCDGGYKSHEDLLKRKEIVCDIYLSATPSKCWGDDWNDAPSCCNSGPAYEERGDVKKITIRLGEPIPMELLANYKES